MIINLPKDLEGHTTHRYGPNSFKLHRWGVGGMRHESRPRRGGRPVAAWGWLSGHTGAQLLGG